MTYQGYDDSNHAVNRSDLSTDLEIDTINPLVLSVSFRNKSYLPHIIILLLGVTE